MITASLDIPAIATDRLIQGAVATAIARLTDSVTASSPTSGPDAAPPPPPIIAAVQIIG